MVLLHVIDAQYLKDYQILLTFNNGVQKMVDLKNELWGEVFEPLKQIEEFKQFHISPLTIEWENGADMSPEFLYSM